MASRSFSCLLIAFIVFASFANVFPKEFVPVSVWGNSKASNLVPALAHLSENDFRDIISERLETRPLIAVFAEENLSPEDFILRDSNGKPAYESLATIIKPSYQFNYYPFVESPIHAFKTLSDVKVTEVSITPDGLPKNLHVKVGDVLVVNLNDAKEGEDRVQMLQRHDSAILSAYEFLVAKYGDVLGVYTGEHASWVVPNEVRSERRTRHLLATGEKEKGKAADGVVAVPKLFNTSDIFFYLADTANISDAENVLANLDDFTASSAENATFITLYLNSSEVSIYFSFEELLGYWYLRSVVYQNGSTNVPLSSSISDVYAPVGFSYHCSPYTNFSGTNPTIVLTIPGFQVQPFFDNKTSSQFGDAYDCVGFTSAPIWSGIFVTFVLALIMTAGLCMMMDIKTMDRFDDPKGKTISINVSE